MVKRKQPINKSGDNAFPFNHIKNTFANQMKLLQCNSIMILYPFKPVVAIPSTKYFCAIKNSIIKGITEIKAIAST